MELDIVCDVCNAGVLRFLHNPVLISYRHPTKCSHCDSIDLRIIGVPLHSINHVSIESFHAERMEATLLCQHHNYSSCISVGVTMKFET